MRDGRWFHPIYSHAPNALCIRTSTVSVHGNEQLSQSGGSAALRIAISLREASSLSLQIINILWAQIINFASRVDLPAGPPPFTSPIPATLANPFHIALVIALLSDPLVNLFLYTLTLYYTLHTVSCAVGRSADNRVDVDVDTGVSIYCVQNRASSASVPSEASENSGAHLLLLIIRRLQYSS